MEVRIAIVTGSRVATNGDGEEPGRILQAIITDPLDVQNVQTCQAGEEYNPPNGVTVAVLAAGSAYKVAVALDDAIAPVMAPGGKRIYSVDELGEQVMAECRLYPDGTVQLFNGAASITMLPSGVIRLDGAQIELGAHVKTDGHVEVGTGRSGVFADKAGQVMTFKNGILVGAQ